MCYPTGSNYLDNGAVVTTIWMAPWSWMTADDVNANDANAILTGLVDRDGPFHVVWAQPLRCSNFCWQHASDRASHRNPEGP
jgi:hypothetical protein